MNTQREPAPEEIEHLAYELWQARGAPYGSSELDWLRAEQILRGRNSRDQAARSEPHPSTTASAPAGVRPDEVRASKPIRPLVFPMAAAGILVAVAVAVILFLRRK